jgi:hypothetical protein
MARISRLLLLAFVMLVQTPVWSAALDQALSLSAAENFFRQAAANLVRHDSTYANIDVSNLAIAQVTSHTGTSGVDFYTVHFSPQGWVIISADDAAVPVLGYSLTGSASAGDSISNESVLDLFSHYHSMMDSIKLALPENPVTRELWNSLLAGSTLVADSLVGDTIQMVQAEMQPVYATTVVPGLLATTWNQGAGWNQYAPTAAGPGGHAWAGCGAVSTAQVMKYYQHPAQGAGVANGYDFSSATYDYAAMPSNTYNSDVAMLLRHVGAAVNMTYGAAGSSSYTSAIALALKNNFLYDAGLSYQRSIMTTSAAWVAMLKGQLDAGRPVIYEGFGRGGHSFVLDGYNSSNYFHANFGWSGAYDGWYALGAMNPGSYNFSSDQGAIIDVHPGTYNPAPGNVLAGGTVAGDVNITGDLFTWVPFNEKPTWDIVPAVLKLVVPADLDADGKMDDLAGLGTDGALWTTSNMVNFTKSRLANRLLIAADLDADGAFDDLAVTDTYNKVWVSLGGGVFSRIDGALANALTTLDLDGDGIKSDLVAMNTTLKTCAVSRDLVTWGPAFSCPCTKVVSYDGDGDGVEDDLVGVQSTGKVFKSVNLSTWTQIPGLMTALIPADFDGDGVRSDLAGFGKNVMLNTLQDTTWTALPLPGVAFLTYGIGDFDADGKVDDLVGATSTGVVYVRMSGGVWVHLNGSLKSPSAFDFDGDGILDDLVGVNLKGGAQYTQDLTGTWIGSVASLVSIDPDKNGSQTMLVAMDNFGALFSSDGNKAWANIVIPEPMYKIIAGDLDGDGFVEGVIGIGKTSRAVYLSSDRVTWRKMAASAEWVSLGDLDGDGARDDLMVSGKDRSLWTAPNQDTLVKSIVVGLYTRVVAADLDGDGFEDDQLGVTSDYKIYQRMNGAGAWAQWAAAPIYFKEVIPFDADGDGVKDDLAAIGKDSKIYLNLDRGAWVYAEQTTAKLWMADLDNDGADDDIVAIRSDGKLWTKMAGGTWRCLASSYVTVAVGDFGAHISTDGSLKVESVDVSALDPSNPKSSGVGRALQLRMRGPLVEISGTPGVAMKVQWVDSKGRTQMLFQGMPGTGGRILANMSSVTRRGLGWIIAKDARGQSAKISAVR